MLIKNITGEKSPKPIGIGEFVIMPDEEVNIPDEIAYVDEFDRMGHKTGKKVILPSIVLLSGMKQIAFTETKKAEKKETKEEVEEDVEEVAPVEEKPRRGRKKAE